VDRELHVSIMRRRRFGDGGALRRSADDRGALLVVAVLMMTLLVGFCAFAVDVGALYNTRRQAQSAADSAALGGGQELLRFSISTTARRQQASAWAKALSYQTASVVPATPAEWNAWFASCTDGSPLAITSPASPALSGTGKPAWPAGAASSCISFSSDSRRMRVVLPNQQVETTFASVLGVDTMDTTAGAEVALGPGGNSGGILPFAVYVGQQNNTTACLRAGSGSFPSWNFYPYSACNTGGGTTGNYGTLDVTVWGSASMASSCSNGDPGQNRLAYNMAEGVDHPLETWEGSTVYDDRAQCPSGSTPNAVWTDTGVSSGVLNSGLVDGVTYDGTTYAGRLRRGNHQTRIIRTGKLADNYGLWGYLDQSLRFGTDDIPLNCDPRTFASSYVLGTSQPLYPAFPAWASPQYYYNAAGSTAVVPGNRSRMHMEMCLADYAAGKPGGVPYTGILFTEEILESPRFAWVPVLDGVQPSGSSANRKILDFKPVFIAAMYSKCSASKGCFVIWEPGEVTFAGSTLAAKRNTDTAAAFDSVSAMMFSDAMIPVAVRALNPSYGGGLGEVELVK